MARHEVSIRVDQEIPVGNRDVEIPIKIDGKAYGRLKVSTGGVDWLPAGKSKSRFAVTWTQLAELITESGRPKPN